MAAELQRNLAGLDMLQYLPNLLHAGIQDWQSLSTITEAELKSLGVRVGHRRKLQRAIARDHLWPENRPLPTSNFSEHLQRHRQRLRRLARRFIDPEQLEEDFYALQSTAQSPWARGTLDSKSTKDGSGEEHEGGTNVHEVLRTQSRLFPMGVPPDGVKVLEEENMFRVLRGLESLGIQIPAPSASPEDDVIPRHADSNNTSSRSSQLSSDSEAEVEVESQSPSLRNAFEGFLQSFNHFLFLYNESDLRQGFNHLGGVTDDNISAEILLVLALGAKASVFPNDEIQNEWYIKARLRLLNEDGHDDLWMMRVLTLICLFEIDDDVEVSYYFLNAASVLGLANGFDAEEPILEMIDEPSRTEGLRLWETIRFLNLWVLLLQPENSRQIQQTQHILDIKQPPLSSDNSYNGRLVQMSISSISNHLQEIIKDLRTWSTSPPSLHIYKAHLKALDMWHAELPPYLCLRAPSWVDSRMLHPEATFHQKTAILNVQSFFLGIVGELLKPALMTVLQGPSTSNENELIAYAGRCVQSSTVLIRLCDEVVVSGYPLSASWIAEHFLFNAALILIADMNRQNSALEEFVSSQERISCLQIAQNLLDQVSPASPRSIIIRILCRAVNLSNPAEND